MAFLYENLLAVADALLDAKNVGTAGRRRAVSTAYYAAFRRLTSLCAVSLAADREDLEIVSRSLQHKPTVNHLKSAKAKSLFIDAGITADIGSLFEELLNAREWADYSSAPTYVAEKVTGGAKFTRADAVKLVDNARAIVAALDKLDERAQNKLAILLTIPTKKH
jgi:hypothetical protein